MLCSDKATPVCVICTVIAGNQLGAVTGVANFVGTECRNGHLFPLHGTVVYTLLLHLIIVDKALAHGFVLCKVYTTHPEPHKGFRLVCAGKRFQYLWLFVLVAGPFCRHFTVFVQKQNMFFDKTGNQAALFQKPQHGADLCIGIGRGAPILQLCVVKVPPGFFCAAVGRVVGCYVLQFVHKGVRHNAGGSGGGFLCTGDNRCLLVFCQQAGILKIAVLVQLYFNIDQLGCMRYRQQRHITALVALGLKFLYTDFLLAIFIGFIAFFQPAHSCITSSYRVSQPVIV